MGIGWESSRRGRRGTLGVRRRVVWKRRPMREELGRGTMEWIGKWRKMGREAQGRRMGKRK